MKNKETLPTHDDQQIRDYYIQERNAALQTLFIESGSIVNLKNGLTNTVRALTTTLEYWILTEYKSLVLANDGKGLEYHEEVISGSLLAIEYIVKMSEVREEVDTWANNSKEKEVSNG